MFIFFETGITLFSKFYFCDIFDNIVKTINYVGKKNVIVAHGLS